MNQPPFFIPPLVQGNLNDSITHIESLLKEINDKLDKIISKKSSYTQEDDNLYML
jgi:hypothetical protein